MYNIDQSSDLSIAKNYGKGVRCGGEEWKELGFEENLWIEKRFTEIKKKRPEFQGLYLTD